MNKQEYKFQYWNNMLLSPFTLCIRGNGNFSVRLYETLAMGRIPVIIDTDCVFPLESQIQWSKHCIIINENIPKKAAMALEIAICRMNKNDIFELQLMNRKLWFENLSFSGFYYSFTRYVFKKYISKIKSNKFLISCSLLSLKFIKPFWYFHLETGGNVIWPNPKELVPSKLLDKNYHSYESMISEASYVALMSGYVKNFQERTIVKKCSSL